MITVKSLINEVCIYRAQCLNVGWSLQYKFKVELIRCCSTATQQKPRKQSAPSSVSKRNEKDTNWVLPPHPVSNLRQIEYKVPSNESELEKRLRNEKIEVQNWNQEFWTNHNAKFYKERKEFIAEKKKELKIDKNTVLAPDEMSKFYKKFLDENYKEHISYNREWYKKNIWLLFASMRSVLYRFSKMFKSIKR